MTVCLSLTPQVFSGNVSGTFFADLLHRPEPPDYTTPCLASQTGRRIRMKPLCLWTTPCHSRPTSFSDMTYSSRARRVAKGVLYCLSFMVRTEESQSLQPILHWRMMPTVFFRKTNKVPYSNLFFHHRDYWPQR